MRGAFFSSKEAPILHGLQDGNWSSETPSVSESLELGLHPLFLQHGGWDGFRVNNPFCCVIMGREQGSQQDRDLGCSYGMERKSRGGRDS